MSIFLLCQWQNVKVLSVVILLSPSAFTENMLFLDLGYMTVGKTLHISYISQDISFPLMEQQLNTMSL